jgi:hypothetical protein
MYKEQQKMTNIYVSQNTVLQEGITNKSDTTIILIGDSILNNNNYIFTEGKSVPDLIKAEHSNTYLFAKDGAVITDCYIQIEDISSENNVNSTYIFVSAGGNNILSSKPGIENKTSLSNEMIEAFFQQYTTLIHSLKSNFPNPQIYLLNLYYPLDPRFKNFYPYIDTWNSLLTDFAENNDLKVIQTNKLMMQNVDFTNAIEPSEIGGKKIANVILDTVIN